MVALAKGSPAHTRCGRIVAWTAWLVGATALAGSLWALFHAESHTPWLAYVDAEEQSNAR
jgi:hypothetical protein